MQQCPTRRIKETRRRRQRGVFQLAQTKAQINPKQGITNQADSSSKWEKSYQPQVEKYL